jgi:2-polyprenyl-6-methoxyphenol hydroxylase-like FAD-dependent oxidoreductase
MTAETRSFRVIVVGAGVAGLTTSHCLQKAGIDHVVIERRTDVAPLMGSSIAIYPNGCRILHQIDCLKAMEASCVPCRWAWNRRPDGKSIVDNGFFGYVKEK